MSEPTFRNGVVTMPDGRTGTAKRMKESTSSNGHTIYTTTEWTTGLWSCTCPGWAIKKPGKERTCKHIKASARVGGQDMHVPGIAGPSVAVRPAAAVRTAGRKITVRE